MITPYLLLLLAPTAASSGPLALRSRLHVPLRGLMVRGPRRYGVRAEEPVRKTKLDGGWTLYEFGKNPIPEPKPEVPEPKQEVPEPKTEVSEPKTKVSEPKSVSEPKPSFVVFSPPEETRVENEAKAKKAADEALQYSKQSSSAPEAGKSGKKAKKSAFVVFSPPEATKVQNEEKARKAAEEAVKYARMATAVPKEAKIETVAATPKPKAKKATRKRKAKKPTDATKPEGKPKRKPAKKQTETPRDVPSA
ncbi:hypothetical protein AAMO2058_000389300 [Amorphochlora amoebiformis]